jgi:hypothetical protein
MLSVFAWFDAGVEEAFDCGGAWGYCGVGRGVAGGFERADGMNCSAGGDGTGEHGEELAEVFLEFFELLVGGGDRTLGHGEGELRGVVLHLALDGLAGAGDGVALVVEEGFYAEGGFDVAAAVEALAGAAFVGFELGEFALPEAEDVGGNVAETGYFADAEVELVGYLRGCSRRTFANWLMLRHARRPRLSGGTERSLNADFTEQYRPPVLAIGCIVGGSL